MIIIKAEIYNSYDMMKVNAFTMIITKAGIYKSYCKMKVDAFIMMIISMSSVGVLACIVHHKESQRQESKT